MNINKCWYKEMAVYQIWPRSFCDGNGDGIGDIKGIMSKLDYIKSLGVDAIWFSPLYKSPQEDMGYDIADYKDIAEEYGTLDEFKELLEAIHARGMKVIMDLVINHTSNQHKWFLESMKSKDNPYHDYYFWRDGKKGGKKIAGFEMSPDMMTMMNGFTVLRLLTMAGGMMDVKFTKEDLLKLNAKLNRVRQPKKKN